MAERRRRLASVFAVLGVTVGVTLAQASPAGAWANYGPDNSIWKTLLGGQVCGSHSTDGGGAYVACRIRFAVSSTASAHSGWRSALGVGAARWCNIFDSDHGVADLCYVDYTSGGGTGGHGVTIGASNLGGRNAMGGIVYGNETHTYSTDPYSAYGIKNTSTVTMNDNPGVGWYVSSNTSSSYAVPSGAVDMQTVIVHETGHSSGFGHPTKVASSSSPVMTACYNGGFTNFGLTDDGNADRWHYGGFASKYGSPGTEYGNCV